MRYIKKAWNALVEKHFWTMHNPKDAIRRPYALVLGIPAVLVISLVAWLDGLLEGIQVLKGVWEGEYNRRSA